MYYHASLNKVMMLGTYNDAIDEDKLQHLRCMKQALALYREMHPEHEFVSDEFPFLYRENYGNNVLGGYFDTLPGKPNVVIIIVEALSRAYCGPGAAIGSCTPFLDSLINNGLYWENCLSTSERTFEAFPSVLGSLPYGRQGFTVDGDMPNHLTMLNILKYNGYRTSIFHASDFKLYGDNWWSFFIKQDVDTILDKACFPTLPDFPCEWGLSDETLFSHASGIMTSQASKPRLDVFLTYSTHEPYNIPHAGRYQAEFVRYLETQHSLSAKQKTSLKQNIRRYATVYYFDRQLKAFFNRLRQNKKFKNTIFVITGDHSFMNLDPHNTIQQYHVPLIVYSPLLKEYHRFDGICSHLDIAPSLLCLLKNSCNIKVPSLVAWLGNMLDTSVRQGKNYELPLLSASKICKDYLSGKHYLNGSALYACGKLTTQRENSDKIYQEVYSHLEAFKMLNQYAYSRDRLVPDSICNQFNAPSVILDIFSLAGFPGTDSVSEFVELVRKKTSVRYGNFNVKLWCDINTMEVKQYDMPRMVVSATNLRDKSSLCYQLDFFKRTDWKSLELNKWQTVTASQSTNFLNQGYDSIEVVSYLWNPNRRPTRYRNIRVELSASVD